MLSNLFKVLSKSANQAISLEEQWLAPSIILVMELPSKDMTKVMIECITIQHFINTILLDIKVQSKHKQVLSCVLTQLLTTFQCQSTVNLSLEYSRVKSNSMDLSSVIMMSVLKSLDKVSQLHRLRCLS